MPSNRAWLQRHASWWPAHSRLLLGKGWTRLPPHLGPNISLFYLRTERDRLLGCGREEDLPVPQQCGPSPQQLLVFHCQCHHSSPFSQLLRHCLGLFWHLGQALQLATLSSTHQSTLSSNIISTLVLCSPSLCGSSSGSKTWERPPEELEEVSRER